jgi:ribosome maturation protein Sdo1
MDIKKVLKEVGDYLLPIVEVKVKELIEAESDKQVDKVLSYLKELIPGQIDDAIIASQAPFIKAKLKELALQQAGQIS